MFLSLIFLVQCLNKHLTRISIFIDIESSVLSYTGDLDIDLNFLGDLYFQGSYRFLDKKFKTFPKLFPKQSFHFPDSQLSNTCR